MHGTLFCGIWNDIFTHCKSNVKMIAPKCNERQSVVVSNYEN